MKITREKIQKVQQLTDIVGQKEMVASDLLRTAQDRFGAEMETFERNGKEITIDRKTMWQEVFYAGLDSDSAKILTERHPEVFAAFHEQQVAADELKAYLMADLMIDMSHMKISDYLNMTVATFEMLMAERGNTADGSVASPMKFG